MSEDWEYSDNSRIAFVTAAWVIALVAAGFPNPEAAIWFVLFPIGLAEVPGLIGLPAELGHEWYVYLAGLVLYYVLTWGALLSAKPLRFYAWYLCLCLLLGANVVGCRHQIAAIR